ncbi:MAG: hypothetical protein D6828_01260 [Nitrospirae bacterium]|nr:MAG: hypothetical protein D6828_01260 [Nitrospirota bacterium]
MIRRYGFGPHTLSVPRLQPAEGAVYEAGEYAVSDEELKRIVAIYRLALPYVGVVVSTREPAALRDELLMMGVSQISAGSKTNPGGYSEKHDTEQFKLTDNRSLDEIVEKIASLGLLPSFCTACYREGRVGEVFRRIAESESMNKFCRANALLSLKEYIRDYAGDKEVIVELLNRELSEIGDNILEKIEEIEHGESDIHI